MRWTKRPLVLTQRGHTSSAVLDVSEHQRLLNELELLRDVQNAVRQLDSGEGVAHGEAERRALAMLRG